MVALRARWPWLLAALVAVAAVVVVWFEPQALFIDKRVSDPVPVVAAQGDGVAPAASAPTVSTPTSSTPTVPPGPAELAAGDLVSLDHDTSGRVRLIELADGSRFVRLEGLRTENGPAVRVYLSRNPATGPEGVFDDDYVDLGELQGNLGDQNYQVPIDADPLGYASVVIWCERFDSAFGAADLVPA